MSLERNEEDEQPTGTSQKKGLFTREMLHRDAARISGQTSRSHISLEQIPQEYEPKEIQTPTLPQGLDEISAMMKKLGRESGVNTEQSKRDEKVLLMASAVLEMCRLLQSFSQTMNAEMEHMNETVRQNLNLQEQYTKSVEEVTHQAVGNIYHNLKAQEKEAINDLMQYVEMNSDQMEKDITDCTENVRSATAEAQRASKEIGRSLERFRKVKTFRDLLYYSSPLFVAADVVIRIICLLIQR